MQYVIKYVYLFLRNMLSPAPRFWFDLQTPPPTPRKSQKSTGFLRNTETVPPLWQVRIHSM